MEPVQTQVDALAKKTSAIPDHGLRASMVRHTLLSLSAERVADLFLVVMSGAETRRTPYVELLQAFSLALADDACDELREATRSVLAGRGDATLARALSRHGDQEDPDAQRVPDFGRGRVLTLGERKSLARRQDRDLIARVLRDPHPHVIRILLGNPGLTEDNVVQLCARRPVPPDVLREVFRQPRWVVRYRVKLALALNPFAPLDVTLQLAPHLTAQDQRRLIAAADLPEMLREVCVRMASRTRPAAVH